MGDIFDPKRFTHSKPSGEGTYGVVVTARDSAQRKRFCALKRQKAVDENWYIIREVVCLRALASSPYVVSLYDILFDGTTCVLVLQGMQRSLSTHYRARRMGASLVRHHFEQVACGLVHLHERGWVHRDVKPSNLLVNDGERVCIGDLGQAALLRPGYAMTLEIGTALYRAPEVWSGCAYDQKVDVWALGCTFAELCMGTHPLRESACDLAIVKRARDVRAAVSAPTYAVLPTLIRCLEPSGDQRAEARELVASVRRLRVDASSASAFHGRLFDRQPNINVHMRHILVDWMLEVSAAFALPSPVRRRAVHVVDVTIDASPGMPRKQLQLVGVAALSFACKLESLPIGIPEARDWAYVTDNTYTIEEIAAMERKMWTTVAILERVAQPMHIEPMVDIAGALHELTLFVIDCDDAVGWARQKEPAEQLCTMARVLRDAHLESGLSKLWKEDWTRARAVLEGM